MSYAVCHPLTSPCATPCPQLVDTPQESCRLVRRGRRNGSTGRVREGMEQAWDGLGEVNAGAATNQVLDSLREDDELSQAAGRASPARGRCGSERSSRRSQAQRCASAPSGSGRAVCRSQPVEQVTSQHEVRGCLTPRMKVMASIHFLCRSSSSLISMQ